MSETEFRVLEYKNRFSVHPLDGQSVRVTFLGFLLLLTHLQLIGVSLFSDPVWRKNKVIRPKSRASALSKKVRQTDRQTIFFKKTFETAIYYSKLLLHYLETLKRDKKPLKRLWEGRTNGRTDRRTDKKVACDEKWATRNWDSEICDFATSDLTFASLAMKTRAPRYYE